MNTNTQEEASMHHVSIIGIDLAKHSFQLHGARADGSVAFRRKLSREKVLDFLFSQPRCAVAMEACASAHYWGRQILKLGHDVKLVPPIYVKPFVKRHKNDSADAQAICEAAQRPTMRFVTVKTDEQQSRGMLFRTRDLLVRQRTQTINALRGHLAEFGLIAPQGPAQVRRLASALEDPGSALPELVLDLGRLLLGQIAGLDAKINGLEKELRVRARQDEEAKRLMTIPGIGPITRAVRQRDLDPPRRGSGTRGSVRQGRRRPGRLDNHRHQATGPASLLAKLTPPGEHQVGVHVVAPRHNRHGNPGLVALRYNPTLLGIAPATTRGNRAFPPGPQLLHCFRHLRSCPLGPWWTPPWCPLPIA